MLPAQSSLGTGWTLVWAKPSVHWLLPVLFCWRLVYEQTDCFSTSQKTNSGWKENHHHSTCWDTSRCNQKRIQPQRCSAQGPPLLQVRGTASQTPGSSQEESCTRQRIIFPSLLKKKCLHYRTILLHSFSPKNTAEASQGYCFQWGAGERTSPGTEHTKDSFTVAQQQETETKHPNAACLLAAQALHPFICTKQLVRDAMHCCATYKAAKKSKVFVVVFFFFLPQFPMKFIFLMNSITKLSVSRTTHEKHSICTSLWTYINN